MESEWLETMSGQQCADALVVEVAHERASAARRLLLVGHWAVLHNGETISPRHDAAGRVVPGSERARGYGGDGTPEVAEFAVHELALLLGLPETVARGELADVLDLQHRHPQLWTRVAETAGCDAPGRDPAHAATLVQAWQARYVARRCRHAKLCAEAARWVDARTTRELGRQPWSRFQDLLDARIKAADPALAEQRRREREATRRLTVSRTTDEGLKTLAVTLPAAQIILMRARIHQLALILQTLAAGQAPGQQTLAGLEADAAFLLCTNPLDALQKLITAVTKQPSADQTAGAPANAPAADAPAGDTAAGDRTRAPDASPAANADDPTRLFDNRPVKSWEPHPEEPDDAGDPGRGSRPEPEAEPDPDLVPESAVHPSDRDEPCPTCGHDPTDPRPHHPALNPTGLTGLTTLAGLDAGKLRPTAILYLHASQQEFRGGTGIVRLENDGRALTPTEAVALLGHCHVKITPVLDLADHHPVDAYEIPDPLAEQVRQIYPTTAFPFSATSSRAHGVDQDHNKPYRPRDAGGPPAQTSLDNLAPLHRSSHRVKTHAPGWTHHTPLFGLHLWRTPHGYCFQHDPYGTTPLGKMTTAEFHQLTHELAEQIAWDHYDETDDTDTGATA